MIEVIAGRAGGQGIEAVTGHVGLKGVGDDGGRAGRRADIIADRAGVAAGIGGLEVGQGQAAGGLTAKKGAVLAPLVIQAGGRARHGCAGGGDLKGEVAAVGERLARSLGGDFGQDIDRHGEELAIIGERLGRGERIAGGYHHVKPGFDLGHLVVREGGGCHGAAGGVGRRTGAGKGFGAVAVDPESDVAIDIGVILAKHIGGDGQGVGGIHGIFAIHPGAAA